MEISANVKKIKYAIIIEVNFTGQFEALLRKETEWNPQGKSIHPLTGEVPTKKYLINHLSENKEILT